MLSFKVILGELSKMMNAKNLADVDLMNDGVFLFLYLFFLKEEKWPTSSVSVLLLLLVMAS